MFSRLKQKVKEESSSLDSPSLIISTNTHSAIKQAKDTSSETGNNSSDDGISGSISSTKVSTNKPLNKVSLERSNSNSDQSKNRKMSRKNSEAISSSTSTAVVTKEDQDDIGSVNINEDVFQESIHDTNIKSELKKLNESLLKQIDDLTEELNEKLNENESLRSQLSKSNKETESYRYELDQFKKEIENYKLVILKYEKELKELSKEKDDLIIKNAELSEKYELLKLVNSKQQSKSEYSKEDEYSKTNCITYSHTEQIDASKQLRDELNEKNKVIKNLQQHLNDMKKTLQKELKYQALPNEKINESNVINKSPAKSKTNENISNHNASMTVPSTPTTPSSFQFSKQDPLLKGSVGQKNNGGPVNHRKQIGSAQQSSFINHNQAFPSKKISNSTHSGLHSLESLGDDVNFIYLKHVVLKFLTSREYEALHLVKALSVLLNFTNEEEKLLKDTIEYKMSWFGTKPRTGQL